MKSTCRKRDKASAESSRDESEGERERDTTKGSEQRVKAEKEEMKEIFRRGVTIRSEEGERRGWSTVERYCGERMREDGMIWKDAEVDVNGVIRHMMRRRELKERKEQRRNGEGEDEAEYT